MKTILTLLLLLLFALLGVSQEVGINKEDPEHTLDVRATSNDAAAEMNISNQDRSRYLRFFSGSNTFPDPSVAIAPGRNLLFASFDDNTLAFNEYMRISSSGDVGIGINNPEARLDILGGDWNLDAGNPGDLRIGNSSYNFRIGIATGGGGAGITRLYTNGAKMFLGTNNRPSLTIDKNENIGIGTTAPIARLEIKSAGFGDTLILLDNQTTRSFVNYGIYMDDKNPNPTVGAYFNVDEAAIVAETACGECTLIYSTSNASTGSGSAVYGRHESPDGYGIQGSNAHPSGTGVRGYASNAGTGSGVGVVGKSLATAGVGVEGEGPYIGVRGEGSIGLQGVSYTSSGYGVKGYNYSATGTTTGVYGSVNSSEGTGVYGIGPKRGVYGFSSAANADGVALYGRATGSNSKGVYSESIGLTGKGVHAIVTSEHSSANAILAEWGGGSSYAGYFVGRVHVAGVLSKSSGTFKIDHPLDPENKYLSHSFVESPDMMNIYNGNITTDEAGYATVQLPDYFEALNMDFRYQLTVIGEFAQAVIGEKINGNSFKIRTDKPNVEVSWQVTGVRNDPFAQKNRVQVEEDKETENIGKYLNAEAFGKSDDKQIGRSGASQLKGSDL